LYMLRTTEASAHTTCRCISNTRRFKKMLIQNKTNIHTKITTTINIIIHYLLNDYYLTDMQAAPLWDPTQCQFVGLLKVTDFIDILRIYKRTNADVSTLATRSISDMIKDPMIAKEVHLTFGFPSADSSTSLKQACKLLLQHSSSNSNKITNSDNNNNETNNDQTTSSSADAAGNNVEEEESRKAITGPKSDRSAKHCKNTRLDFLPIVMPEDMRVLACITYTNILEHLVTHFRETRRLFDDSIYDLKIGTYHDKLIKVGPDESLARALELMHEHELSAIPVVDLASDRLIGVYSRSDITFLTRATDAEDAVANLDLTLNDVLEQQRTDVTTPDAMHSCSTAHTLQSIFEYFAQLRFNRLFVLDESERLVGVVSAKDLVAYFMID
jgi:5'-AMP-activated protein kinase regulatory gamma subunit